MIRSHAEDVFEVWMPSRFIRRNVGGNSTYARSLMHQYDSRGYPVRLINSGRGVLQHILFETAASVRSHGRGIVHFVADTGSLIRTRTPSVVTVQGVASRWISTARTPAQEALWRYRVRRAIRSTSRVITGSQSSAADISEVFDVPRDDIVVIPHGIDSDTFAIPRELSAEIADRVPDEFLLYLGNIEPRKNLVQLIQALEIDPLRTHGLPLVIAGRPAWNFEESMAAIAASPNVIYLGFVSAEDRAALLQRCTLFVFPSLYEGFGFPPLEAMAAGAPTAASHRGSLAEVAGPAYRIDDVDPNGIAVAVSGALSDSRWLDEAPSAGKAWVRQYSWESSADRHIRTYLDVMDEFSAYSARV